MRPLVLLLILVVACGGQTEPQPGPDPEQPISENLFTLETTPKIADFVVVKGASAVLEVRSKIFSPSVKKINITISSSSGVSIEPLNALLEGNATTNFTVKVGSDVGQTKPYFYVNGSALDKRGDSITANSVSLKFQWDATPPPPTP